MKKSSLLARFTKNILLFGSLFIILSIVIDWYRKPTAPAQFADQVFYDLGEQPRVIAQLSHQKPMLLYFWGSWCHFCQYTSPAVQQFAEQGLPILSIALQSGTENELRQYLADNRYTFSVVNDPDGRLSKQWGIQATPTILIIKDGRIINHTTGLTSYWGLKIRLWLAEFG